jgi:hypothetical protein
MLRVGSPKVTAFVDDASHLSFISRISLVEMHSAFARRVRAREITTTHFQRWRRRFFADLRARKFRIVRSTAAHEREAIRLLVKHGLAYPLRTIDALQLAVAVWLWDQSSLDHFVCADAKLCTVAQREGLSILNPEVS